MEKYLINKHIALEGTEQEHIREATYSNCRKYRYGLKIVWDKSKPIMVYCCLNPSTATEMQNDPTIERLERRARQKDFGGMWMLNIFAYRATEPKDMKSQENPVGTLNDDYISYVVSETGAKKIHCGWGNHGLHLDRQKQITELFNQLGVSGLAIKINKNGTPAHPLYQSYKKDFDLEI